MARTSARALAMPLDPGTTLGPYSVSAKNGEGGMGEVYRARDTKRDHDSALDGDHFETVELVGWRGIGRLRALAQFPARCRLALD